MRSCRFGVRSCIHTFCGYMKRDKRASEGEHLFSNSQFSVLEYTEFVFYLFRETCYYPFHNINLILSLGIDKSKNEHA